MGKVRKMTYDGKNFLIHEHGFGVSNPDRLIYLKENVPYIPAEERTKTKEEVIDESVERLARMGIVNQKADKFLGEIVVFILLYATLGQFVSGFSWLIVGIWALLIPAQYSSIGMYRVKPWVKKNAKRFISEMYDWEQENRYYYWDHADEYDDARKAKMESICSPRSIKGDNETFYEWLTDSAGLEIIFKVERTAKDVDASWKEW